MRTTRPFPSLPVAAASLLLAAATTSAQQPIPLDTLHASAASRLVAGAAAATRSVEVFDRARIAQLPVGSLNDLLARAVGVDLLARSPAQADLAIRGSGFEQVLVMVDGVPVNDDQTGHFHLDLAVPLDAVERVEVLRGPASALYGSSAVGGVINIVTRRDAELRPDAATVTSASARVQAGAFGTAAGGGDVRFGRGATRLHASAGYDRADGHRPGTDYAILQGRIGLATLVGGGSLSADAGWAGRDFGAEGFYAPYDSWEETRTTTASAAWRSRPAALTVEPRLSFRRHGDDFILVRDNPALYRNLHTTRQSAAEVVARWTPADARVRLAAGVEGAASALESTNLGDRSEERWAAFGELAAGDVGAVLATGGVRVDWHSTFGTHVSPSAAAGWQATPALRLRASAGGGFRAPSWTDRYYIDPANIGDPDLGAETFRTAEVGATLAVGGAPADAAGPPRTLRVDVAGFVRQARDMIDWVRPAGAPPTEPWRTMNVDRVRFLGLETSLTTGLGRADITLRATLLDVDADTTRGLDSKYGLRPLTRTLAAEARAPLPGGFTVAPRVAMYRRSGGDDWHLVDLRLSHQAGRLSLFADGTNLTNARYADVSDRPAPGRAWLVGTRLTY